jgi:hypothetical protein
LSAPIVRVLVLALAHNLLRARNAVEQAKYVVFVKACLVKWSLVVHVAVVAAWAQLSLLRVQSVQAKVGFHLVSRSPLMFREELTQVRQ